MSEDNDPGGSQLPDDRLWAAHQDGDEAARAVLFRRYYVRLIELTREKMGGLLREVEDSSDVVQSVFESLFKPGRAHRIEVGTGESLWPLLFTIMLNKLRSHARHWRRKRRDRSREVRLDDRDLLETGPSPEDAKMLHEQIEELLEPFSSQRREVLKGLLQGLSAEEVARQAGVSRRTVYRTRKAAREILEQILAAS